MTQPLRKPIQTEPLSFRLDSDLAEQLRKRADANDRPLSGELRRAIRRYLKEAA